MSYRASIPRQFGPIPRTLDDALAEVAYWRDLWRGLFEKGTDAPVTLTQSQAAIFRLLDAANGRVVAYDLILQAVYASRDEPEDPKASLEVQVCYLRKKIRAFGYAIKTRTGEGYQMIKPDSAIS